MLTLWLFACSEQSVVAKNAPPAAEITSHEDGATAQEGYSVLLRGSASDPDNDPLNLTTIWYLGPDEICNGTASADGTTTCDIVMTTEGSVTLEVRDPQNAAAADTITFDVSPTGAPEVRIQQPQTNDALFSDIAVTFEGTVSDSEDSPDLLVSEWTSDIDGALGVDSEADSNGLIQGSGFLSEGTHLITLTTTDTSGKIGSDSVSIQVSAPNQAPTCSISAPANNSAGPSGSLVVFEGLTGDPDGNAADLTVQWISDKDDLIGTSQPDSAGAVSFATSDLSVNTHTISMRVTDPFGEICVANTIYSVSTPPVISLNAPLDGDVFPEGAVVLFEGTVIDGEDQPTDIEFTWESAQAGQFSTQGANSNGELSLTVSTLPVGLHDITVTATDTACLFDTETLSIRINQAPSQPSVSITPNPAYSSNTLTCTPSGSVDPDGQTISYSYLWSLNGVPTSYTGSSLSSVATSKNQDWTCTVTPSDGIADGTPGSASITIANSPPVLSSVTILPGSNVSTTAQLTCVAAVSDADNEPLAIAYSWTLNGAPVGNGNSLDLSSLGAQLNDTVTCSANAVDSDGASVSGSASATVSNGPPSISSVAMTPSSAYTNTTLTATPVASDPEGDPISFSYQWRVNGVLQSPSSNTLDGAQYFDRDDLVAVTVTASDPNQSGLPYTASTTILNTAPTSATPSITPSSPIEGLDDIICEITAPATDEDGDPIDYIITWTVDGIDYPDGDTAMGWQGPGTTTHIDDTIPSVDMMAGDVWVCTVTPTDGTDDGPSSTSSATVSPSSSCGNNILDTNEEYDPAPGPYNNISIDPITCRWDFSSVNQLYCNGGCTWTGSSDCDQTEADILCKLKMDNPNSTAISWTSTTALPEHGFPCPWYPDTINVVNRGVSVSVQYQDFDILGNHGPGNVIAYPVCTDP